MDNLEIKDVDCLEEMKLKITELKNKDSLYFIEIKDYESIKMLQEYTREKGFYNIIFCNKMPNVKEIKKVGKES